MNIDLDVVPTDLDSALKLLEDAISEEERQTLKKEVPAWHFGVGLWLRNNWSLWEKRTPFVLWFKDKGIIHADDMSAIILESFLRKIRGQDIALDEQIKKYRDYWSSQGINPDTMEKQVK